MSQFGLERYLDKFKPGLQHATSPLGSFIDSGIETTRRMITDAPDTSYQELMGLALSQALVALRNGTYGIGGAYIHNDGKGFQRIVLGRNQILDLGNSGGHAERVAIGYVDAIIRGNSRRRGVLRARDIPPEMLITRKVPPSEASKQLITTLEPCAACYQTLLTHNGIIGPTIVSDVLIGVEDPSAGGMSNRRADSLGDVWQAIRARQEAQIGGPLRDIYPDYQNPNAENYVDPQYQALLEGVFLNTRQAIDDLLGSGGRVTDPIFAVNFDALGR